MKNKMKLYVFSHLSDAQELIRFCKNSEARERINFAKFLILKCDGDLNKEFDVEELDNFWTEFKSR